MGENTRQETVNHILLEQTSPERKHRMEECRTNDPREDRMEEGCYEESVTPRNLRAVAKTSLRVETKRGKTGKERKPERRVRGVDRDQDAPDFACTYPECDKTCRSEAGLRIHQVGMHEN